jgi:hypothetical protein
VFRLLSRTGTQTCALESRAIRGLDPRQGLFALIIPDTHLLFPTHSSTGPPEILTTCGTAATLTTPTTSRLVRL